MGSWGAGVFDNDDAQDFLGDLMDGLAAHVVGTLQTGDAYLGSVAAAAEVMALLAKQWQTAPPQPSEIQAWKADFLEAYQVTKPEASRVDCGDDPYCSNVLASLDALSQLSQNFSHVSSEAPEHEPGTGVEFYVGMEVSHPKFGSGTILEIEGVGQASRARVAFASGGEKWLALAVAGLSPL